MTDRLLLGLGRHMIPIPAMLWKRAVRAGARKTAARLAFMSEDHHRVRDFAVLELPRIGVPLAPERIAEVLDLSIPRVRAVLDELERRLTFVFRNQRGHVTWAYPVTVDETPHRARFETGEDAYSPWAIDTFAMPFVQGHLRNQPLSITFETECAHCTRPMRLEVDGELRPRVLEGTNPIVFAPLLDFEKLKAPNIIDDFWRKSVFFWSEEHAREQRRRTGGARGVYLTPSQAAHVTRLSQSALFAFPRR